MIGAVATEDRVRPSRVRRVVTHAVGRAHGTMVARVAAIVGASSVVLAIGAAQRAVAGAAEAPAAGMPVAAAALVAVGGLLVTGGRRG